MLSFFMGDSSSSSEMDENDVKCSHPKCLNKVSPSHPFFSFFPSSQKICEKHSVDLRSWRCVVTCENKKECNFVCKKCCGESSHGHCKKYSCSEPVHGSFDICSRCCEFEIHSHCSVYDCGKERHFGGKCIEHCREENHGHCVSFGCSLDSHLDGRYCTFHCTDPKHKYCAEMLCGNFKHGNSNFCEFHCTDKKHTFIHCATYMCEKVHSSSEICCEDCARRVGDGCILHACKVFDCYRKKINWMFCELHSRNYFYEEDTKEGTILEYLTCSKN